MSSPLSPTPAPTDFVSGDLEALARHMRHCTSARGPWFAIESHLERMHSVAAGRIVTLASVSVVLAIGLMAIA